MKHFNITLRFQYPAWDERNGISWEVTAKTKAEAIMVARRYSELGGHTPAREKGRYTFKAELVEG